MHGTPFHFATSAASALAAILLAGPVAADEIERTFEVGSHGKLDLKTDFGSIDVRASDESRVRVRVRRRGQAEDRLDVEMTLDGSTVRIRGEVRNPGRYRDGSASFDVFVPPGFEVQARTSGGSIGVEGIDGAVEVSTSGGSLDLGRLGGTVRGHTSGGSIQLKNSAGDVKLSTSGGSVRIGDVQGDVEASTSGGSIGIGKVTGRVRARTSGGSIEMEEILGSIDAHTSGGNVTAYLSGQPAERSELRTSGGTLRVYIADGIGLDIDADGEGVESDFAVGGRFEDEHVLRGAINGGGPELVLRASGRIRIRRR